MHGRHVRGSPKSWAGERFRKRFQTCTGGLLDAEALAEVDTEALSCTSNLKSILVVYSRTDGTIHPEGTLYQSDLHMLGDELFDNQF